MAYFMDLYAPWVSYNYTMEERNRIWVSKRDRLIRDEYNTTMESSNDHSKTSDCSTWILVFQS